MKSLWNDADAPDAPLPLRVYTSRLLGQNPALVLHGGGNTSVKLQERTFLGDQETLLYVKGSGWDLATIEKDGFPAVRLRALRQLAEMEALSDAVIVREQRAAMTNPYAPNPSVEAILHALIPYRFVDHTHADAVVTITNTPGGEAAIRRLYGDRVLVVPYVMAGFSLARKVYEVTRGLDWAKYDAMVLLHHGVFTFADDARASYETMIRMVSQAEAHLEAHGAAAASAEPGAPPDPLALARLRQAVSRAAGRPMLACVDTSAESRGFADLPNAAALATRGLITPDHVSRIKHTAAVLTEGSIESAIDAYARAYRAYFARHAAEGLMMLDPAPRWVVWPGVGSVGFGHTAKMAAVVRDIARHTARAIQWAEALGGWQPLREDHYFDMEYWELQQAKHKKAHTLPPLTGKVALVACADDALRRACSEALRTSGASVTAGAAAPEDAVARFGGLDIVVSDRREPIERAAPYLRLGIDPTAVWLCREAPGEALHQHQHQHKEEGVRFNTVRLSGAMQPAAMAAALAGGAFAGAERIQVE